MVKREDENQEGEERSDSQGDQGVTGLGALLREERERKGLSLEDMEIKTRLRPHVLAAIEAEKWDLLPQAVFVRGFIRSYAEALGIGRVKVAELCNKAFPKEEAPPKELDSNRSHRKRTFLYLILAIIIVGGLAYLLQGGQAPQKEAQLGVPEEPRAMEAEGKSPDLNEKKGASLSEAEEKKDIAQGSGSMGNAEADLKVGALNPVETGEGGDEKEMIAQKEEKPALEPKSAPPVFLELKGVVYERTWIKICIDDEEAEEYIFQRGSQPQWRGKKGFRVIIGNAAGISFEFNGREYKNLGQIGQVIKLAFPENFVSRYCED